MPLCEAIICQSAVVNNATIALTAIAPTSLTIRDSAYGKAKITHAMALCSTDDVAHVYVVPSGYKDSKGFEVPCVTRYAATASLDLEDAILPQEVAVPSNSTLAVYAQSETAANTVVTVWLWIEYAGNGAYQDIKKGEGMTQRELDAGAALTSNVAADGTVISDLQAGQTYQPIGISGVAVDGTTAGIVGPAFVKLKGPAEFSGMECFVPIVNSGNFVATGEGAGWADFRAAKIKMPVFKAPNNVTPVFLGYTAERPIGRLLLAVDKVY